MSNDKAYRDLAAMVVELQKRVDGLSTSQLAHSSLENTGLNTYDAAGQLSGIMGRLPDGSYGFATTSGPTPPIPSAPKARAIRGIGLEVEWDGLFRDPSAVVPLEGGRLEFYIHEDMSALNPTLVPTHTVESPRGGKFLISVGYDQTHYIGFAFRAASGKVSALSDIVGPVTVGRATKEDLEVNFEALRGTRIFYGPDEPETDAADLWLRDNPDGTQTALRYDPDPAVADWIELQDQGVVQALQQAAEANELANEAGLAALAAQGTANTAYTAAGDANAVAGAAASQANAASVAAQEAAQDAADAAAAALAARGVADAAATAAATAQTAADEADAAALAAAGLAGSKGQVYYQTSAPVPGDSKSLWIDIDDGNKPYRFVSNAWSAVENASVKAAADAAALADQKAVDAATAASTAATAAATADAKAVQAAADALAASNLAATKAKVFNQTSAPTTGMQANDVWHDTDDGNRRYVYIGSTWTAQQLGASGISATARQLGAIYTFRQASAPTSGIVGDFWIDSDDNVVHRYDGAINGWVRSQDANVNIAITNAATAKAVADGKMRIFTQATPPTDLTADDVGDLWIDTDDSNVSYTWEFVTGTTYGWLKRQLGNGAITPNSLVASNVIATGTVSAALFEALLVLTTELIAGDPLGNHARMTPDGFRVFQEDPIDGVPNEVIRMGTATSDYFGIVDATGVLVATVDNTGSFTGNRASFKSLLVEGKDVAAMFTDVPQGEIARFSQKPASEIGKIFPSYGLCEVGGVLVAGRAYRIDYRASFRVEIVDDEVLLELRFTKGASGNTSTQPAAPSLSSTLIDTTRRTGTTTTGRWHTVYGSVQYYPTTTSRYRVLLDASRGPAGSTLGGFWVTPDPVELMITDLGPAGPTAGAWSSGGGKLVQNASATPAPVSTTQQYYVDLAPAAWESLRGNGTQRTDVPGPVQGWDPSGFNGDGKGRWVFNMPNITGTVDQAIFYSYTNHWGPNAGGTAIFNLSTDLGFGYQKPRSDYYVPGFQRAGGRETLIPSDWLPFFRSAGAFGYPQAKGITVGVSGTTNNVYYGRWDGPSARLRIWYTQ